MKKEHIKSKIPATNLEWYFTAYKAEIMTQLCQKAT